jgi:hypothetical protein
MSKIKEQVIAIVIILSVIGTSVYTHINLNRKVPIEEIACIGKITPPEVNTEGLITVEMVDTTVEQQEDQKEEVAPVQNVVVEETSTDTNYTEDDLYWLSKAIAQELGSYWVPDWAQQWVASVVLNRVNHPSFPDTIYGVLHQPGQYCGFYATPTEQNVANAKYVLENGSVLPENVVFQSLNTQGSGVHGSYYDPHMGNTTYFCYQ